MRKLVQLLGLFISLFSHAQVCENKGPNIILFTWDCVRNQENKIPQNQRGEVFLNFWSVLERIKREAALDKKDVPVFASWDRIIAAIAKDPHSSPHELVSLF